MKDETKLLIKLIKENKTLNEISSILGLSNKQIFTRLSMIKNIGYVIDRKYDYNGEITYSISNPIFPNNTSNEVNIQIPNDIKKIKAVLTSDNHLGSKKDSIISADLTTEYCIKNNIHLNFNTGDFFHGIYQGDSEVKYSDPFKQLQYGLKNYPYDKNILTFVCLGNHDASFWIEYGLDIKTILLEKRHDIIPVGYGYGIVNIGKHRIRMQHPIDRCNLRIPSNNERIILMGHSHKFKAYGAKNKLVVHVPTLSNMTPASKEKAIPSMIEMTLNIHNGIINNLYFQQFMVINNQLIRTGEMQYDVPIRSMNVENAKDKKANMKPNLASNEPVSTISKSEENLSDNISKTIIEVTKEKKQETTAPSNRNCKRMSQIEKFNARYNHPKTKVLKK